MNLDAMFPILVPLATKWGRRQTKRIQLHGVPLTEAELVLARAVGVAFPERVRLMIVPVICSPIAYYFEWLRAKPIC